MEEGGAPIYDEQEENSLVGIPNPASSFIISRD